eukprot:SAG11_NODE_22189_length_410_cov_1.466238_1_plen_81_part_00
MDFGRENSYCICLIDLFIQPGTRRTYKPTVTELIGSYKKRFHSYNSDNSGIILNLGLNLVIHVVLTLVRAYSRAQIGPTT